MPSTWAVVYHTIYQAILEPGIDMMGFYATAIVYRGESDFWQNTFEYLNEKKKKKNTKRTHLTAAVAINLLNFSRWNVTYVPYIRTDPGYSPA